MTPEEIEEFLENNVNNLSEDELRQASDDAKTLGTGEFVAKWDKVFKEKTSGWNKVRPKSKSIQERISDEFGADGYNVPENYRYDVWEEKFQDIPYEKFSENIDKMRQYYESYNKEREYEAGRKRREKEVKNWNKDWFTTPWMRNLLASEYEKRRYIEHPEEALFGEEAPELGKAENTRWGAIGDLAAGTAGAAADVGLTFVPGIGWVTRSVAGPAIRAGRDVAHKATGSEYQKDWSDIGSGLWGDVATNASFEALPNLRKFSRIMGSEKASKIGTVLDVENETKMMKKQLDNFPAVSELKSWNNTDLYKMIDDMPEGQLKQNFKQYAKDIHSIDRAGIADEIDRARKYIDVAENPEIRNAMKTVIDVDQTFTPKVGERVYESKAITKPELTGFENFAKNVQKVGRLIPENSTPILKAGTDVAPVQPVKEDTENRKKWYKENYTRDWLMGFTPDYIEGDPKWEAFEEEFPERAAEVKRKKEK